MLYMVMTTFPMKSSVDAGKIFVEELANPLSHVNRVDMWISYGGDGVKTWEIHETEKGYDEEGYLELSNYLAKYRDVEGFKIDILPVLKPEDALSLIGMAPPA
jgi:hypothetical protein